MIYLVEDMSAGLTSPGLTELEDDEVVKDRWGRWRRSVDRGGPKTYRHGAWVTDTITMVVRDADVYHSERDALLETTRRQREALIELDKKREQLLAAMVVTGSALRRTKGDPR